MTFKVGDTVRTSGGSNRIIIKIVGHRLYYRRDDGSMDWFHEDNAELLKPAMDEREQAIYKRLCNIKRPRPKGEFKVGDKVRIRTTLTRGDEFESREGKLRCRFIDKMCMYRGEITRIIRCMPWGGEHQYKLDIDNERWSWTKEMLVEP